MCRDYILDLLTILWIICNRGIDLLLTIYGLDVGYIESEPITKYFISSLGLWIGSISAFILSIFIILIFYGILILLTRHKAIYMYRIYIRMGFLTTLLSISLLHVYLDLLTLLSKI